MVPKESARGELERQHYAEWVDLVEPTHNAVQPTVIWFGVNSHVRCSEQSDALDPVNAIADTSDRRTRLEIHLHGLTGSVSHIERDGHWGCNNVERFSLYITS
jgi:hypothetical protein